MKKIELKSNMEFEIVLKLNEEEARALNAITLYGSKQFLKYFYEHMGEHYLKPHENGLVSLFDVIDQNLPKQLNIIDKCRKAWSESVEPEMKK